MWVKKRRGLKKYITIAVSLLFCFAPYGLQAQQTPAQEAAPDAPPAAYEAEGGISEEEKTALKEKEDRDRIIELDIKTSTLSELAEWCKEIGLGEGGTREEMVSRLKDFYGLGASAQRDEQRVVTIESARTTEYFTLKSVNEEYARLSGGVVISLKDGPAVIKLGAQDILFNRTRNVVSASGGVTYVREEGGAVETFEGDSIILNLDTWVGNFIDTISERSMEGADTAYRFAGKVISKTDTDTTVLKNARISNAKTDEPYWSLNATRLWLFPGSDWAVFNAVLKVGEIPVLYMPFFVYPADEVIFHPVIGSRTRHGYYLQTTTYIFGRPIPDPKKSNSISKILGSGDGMEKARDGLFLRSTGRKETANNSKIFSVLFDVYSNLGFYGGLELNMLSVPVLGRLKFSGGLGWTRTLYENRTLSGIYYTPFEVNDKEWVSDWNKSFLFGTELPFRYRLNMETSASGRFGSIDLKFPLYSDPFIDTDVYANRSEQMDWMGLLRNGSIDDLTMVSSTISSYQWVAALKPNIATSIFNPYISSMSIDTVSTVLAFEQKNDANIPSNSSKPERAFFIPKKLTPYSISASAAGSPLSLGSKAAGEKETAAEPLKDFGVPVSPWAAEDEGGAAKGAKLKPSPNSSLLTPPALGQSWKLPKSNALNFTLTYGLTPASASEMEYNTGSDIKTAKDVNFSNFQSVMTNTRTDGTLNFLIAEVNNGLFQSDLGFSGNYQSQDHGYIDEKLSASEKTSMRLNDYRATQWIMNSTYNFSLKPFYWNSALSGTSFTYTINALLAHSLFDEQKYSDMKQSNPNVEPDSSWRKTDYFDFTREFVSTHRFTASWALNVMEKAQNLSFFMDLPPLYRTYGADATARVWILDSRANMQIREDTVEGKAAAQNLTEPKYHYINGYVFMPLYLTENFNLGNSKSLVFYGVWDPELSEWTNFTTNFSAGSFRAAYASVRMYKYYYDSTPGREGWKQESGQQDLYPRDFTVSWSPSVKFDSLFHNLGAFTLGASSSVNIDLQRYTYSRLSFNMNFTVGISKFLDFKMGSTSENAEIYRYVQDLPFFQDLRSKILVGAAKENNPLLDFLNSFRFDSDTLRQQSGFKLKSFDFSAVHHLGDWDATASVSFSPYLDNSSTQINDWRYRFRTTFSFLIQWLPITEIETQLDYENEKFIKKAKQQ